MEEILAQIVNKDRTQCCALGHLNRISNHTPKDAIQARLVTLTREMEENEEVGVSWGKGQTTFFTVISPGEDVLERNLLELGFVEIAQFERRRGYPATGDLKLMLKKL